MIRNWLILLPLLLAGVLDAHAASPAIWTGRSGGYEWTWSNRDVSATTAGKRVPILSLRRLLKTEPDPDVQSSWERSVTVLSVVGPLVSVRVDDFWTGGAHPSGETWYQTFDARTPTRVTTLTDYLPYSTLRKPLFNDPVVGRILRGKGLKAAPLTSGQLEALLKNESFQSGGIEYAFSEHPLRQFSFHHLEGGQVAVRLNVSWAHEALRFRTTEIGVLAVIPAKLKSWLEAASSGKAGFLRRSGARRFKDKTAKLMEWSRD